MLPIQPLLIWKNSKPTHISRNLCNCTCNTDYLTHKVKSNQKVDNQTNYSIKNITIDPGVISNLFDVQYHYLINTSSDKGIIVLNPLGFQLLHEIDKAHSILQILENHADLDEKSILQFAERMMDYDILRDKKSLREINKESVNTEILDVWLNITSQCNLNCSYCYIIKNNDVMSFQTGMDSLQAVFKTAKQNHLKSIRLKYAGGEPTMQFPLIQQLHTQAKKLSAEFNIEYFPILISNGVLFSDEIQKTIVDEQFEVMISLDGLYEFHDQQRPSLSGRKNFDKVEQTILKLLEAGVIPDISVTITNKNAEGIPQLVDYLIEKELRFSLNLYRENENISQKDVQYSEDQITECFRKTFEIIRTRLPNKSFLNGFIDMLIFDVPHQHTCSIGNNYLVIDTDGKITKCQMLLGRKQDVTSIYAEDLISDLRNAKDGISNSSVNQKNDCKTCPWKYNCAGGCPITSYINHGHTLAKSPNCTIYQTIIPELLTLEAQRIIQFETPEICN